MLLQVMENQRDDLVVILAGYKERMDIFFQSNPGFRSRITHYIEFPDYTLDVLMAIAELILHRQMYSFDAESRNAFAEYLTLRVQQPYFANVRSVRNAIDRAKLARLADGPPGGVVPGEELARIDADDIRQSRVFQGGIDT